MSPIFLNSSIICYNTPMNIVILTLFPEMFEGPFHYSIIKRAQDKKLVSVSVKNLRDFAIDKRGTVDDKPYGGGVGMVLRPEPLFDAVSQIKKGLQGKTKVVLLSANGIPYSQQKAEEYSKIDNVIFIAGHYEGVDQRVIDLCIDEEISIGDFVLTGGEIPAMVLVDSIVRLVPSVLEKKEAVQNESFSQSSEGKRLLEHPQYTRPIEFKGKRVPDVLISGNHKDIENWKKEESINKTKKVRPDLLK